MGEMVYSHEHFMSKINSFRFAIRKSELFTPVKGISDEFDENVKPERTEKSKKAVRKQQKVNE